MSNLGPKAEVGTGNNEGRCIPNTDIVRKISDIR
jgi:hypothetical protein